jgi:type I restriction enzyme S subunit
VTLLGSALELDVDAVDVAQGLEYRIAGVYSFGRGLFTRGPISATDTTYKKLHRLHEGQLVVSRLKAFEGAVAVVPHELDGWFLSPEFPTFRCLSDELEPAYLSHICRWETFWSMLAARSTGIGARRERVHASSVLALEIPLPPIDEQRRAAARLAHVETATNKLRERTTRATTLTEALVVSAAMRLDLSDEDKHRDGWKCIPLGDVLEPSGSTVPVEPANEYLIAGIYSFGRGLIDRGPITGSDTSYTTLTRLAAGDIVVSKLNGWEGAVAVVDEGFVGYHVSSEYPSFTPDRQFLLPEFFSGIAQAPSFWNDLNTSARGSMVRRRRINPKEFLATPVWLPPADVQAHVARTIALARAVGEARVAAAARVDALLPAALNEAFAPLT